MRTFVVVALAALALSAGDQDKPKPTIYAPDAMKWENGPKSLPPGAKMVVLEGDPAAPGPSAAGPTCSRRSACGGLGFARMPR